MYTLFTDETNTQPDENVKFFVYGGLIIPNNIMQELHNAIGGLRIDTGFETTDELKFDTRSRPERISVSSFRNIKSRVVDECIRLGCRFVATYVLHDIAKDQTNEQRISWGANCLIKSFNEFLKSQGMDKYGFVIADRYNKAFEIFKEKFQKGLYHQKAKNYYFPDRTLGYFISCSGSSHFVSAADIVIGSFRYCINDPSNVDAARAMYKKINIMQYSVTEHPFTVISAAYQKEYDGLKSKLEDLKTEKIDDDIPF